MLGIVVALVLRSPMLVRERLVFPAGVATAETLREIHAGSPGDELTFILGGGLAGSIEAVHIPLVAGLVLCSTAADFRLP